MLNSRVLFRKTIAYGRLLRQVTTTLGLTAIPNPIYGSSSLFHHSSLSLLAKDSKKKTTTLKNPATREISNDTYEDEDSLNFDLSRPVLEDGADDVNMRFNQFRKRFNTAHPPHNYHQQQPQRPQQIPIEDLPESEVFYEGIPAWAKSAYRAAGVLPFTIATTTTSTSTSTLSSKSKSSKGSKASKQQQQQQHKLFFLLGSEERKVKNLITNKREDMWVYSEFDGKLKDVDCADPLATALRGFEEELGGDLNAVFPMLLADGARSGRGSSVRQVLYEQVAEDIAQQANPVIWNRAGKYLLFPLRVPAIDVTTAAARAMAKRDLVWIEWNDLRALYADESINTVTQTCVPNERVKLSRPIPLYPFFLGSLRVPGVKELFDEVASCFAGGPAGAGDDAAEEVEDE